MSRTLATVMLAGGLLAAGQAVAEDHDMTPTHETDSGPLLWHNESLTYLYGKNFKINPPIQQTFTLEHASGWTWGDLFIFFDQINYNGKEDASNGKNTYYGEITPRLSFGKLTGADLSFGPVKDVLLAGTYEFGEGDTEAYLLGPGFDLAIRSGVEQDARLVARPLFVLQEITCASPAYLARHGEPQRPAELAERECLLNSHYSGHEEWLYHRHHRLERVRVAGFLASNHYSLLKKAALAGTGIARLPSYMVHDELGDGRLAWLLRDYQTRSTPMFLVHPFQGGLPRRTQVLADYLLDWFERSRRQLIGLEG